MGWESHSNSNTSLTVSVRRRRTCGKARPVPPRHLHRDLARPSHISTGTGLTRAGKEPDRRLVVARNLGAIKHFEQTGGLDQRGDGAADGAGPAPITSVKDLQAEALRAHARNLHELIAEHVAARGFAPLGDVPSLYSERFGTALACARPPAVRPGGFSAHGRPGPSRVCLRR